MGKNHAVLMLLLFAFVAVAVTTGCSRRSHEQRAEGMINSIADKLDLNEAQKTKLNALKQETLARVAPMRAERERSFDELIAAMRSPQADPQKMKALAERNRVQAEEFISFFSSKFVEFHDMLTPEQREKAAREMERWREHERGHGARGGGKEQK